MFIQKLFKAFRLFKGEIVVFSIAFMVFSLIILLGIVTDLQNHAGLLINAIEFKSFPPTPVYYILILVFALFQLNLKMLFGATILVLSGAVAFKYHASKILLNYLGGVSQKEASQIKKNKSIKHVFLLIMLFVVPVYIGTEYWYLGKLPINNWHNSTSILLMPFAIFIFFQSVLYLENGKRKALYYITIFSLISILIKPSFHFIFAPVFMFFVLFKYRLTLKFWYAFLAISISSLAVLFIYVFTYMYGDLDLYMYKGQKSGIQITPFAVWHLYSKNILLDAIFSILFPLSFIIFYFKEIFRNRVVLFAFSLFFLSVLIFIFFSESGPRFTHANFIWQVIVANYILFLTCLSFFYKSIINKQSLEKRDVLLSIFLGAHFLSGVCYLLFIFINKSYH